MNTNPQTLSPVRQIRGLFALPRRRVRWPTISRALLDKAIPRSGGIVLIVGASGAGKSRLLRAAVRLIDKQNRQIVRPDDILLPDRPVIDIVCHHLPEQSENQSDDPPSDEIDNVSIGCSTIERALELLGRVGLAEAWTYLQRPSCLSDGQRWRLRLALAIARCGQTGRRSASDTNLINPSKMTHEDSPRTDGLGPTSVLVIDEFAAVLDRVTACVVSRSLRRLVSSTANAGVSAVVATSHDDLIPALLPDSIIFCDYGRIEVLSDNNGLSDKETVDTPTTPAGQ